MLKASGLYPWLYLALKKMNNNRKFWIFVFGRFKKLYILYFNPQFFLYFSPKSSLVFFMFAYLPPGELPLERKTALIRPPSNQNISISLNERCHNLNLSFPLHAILS